MPNPVAGKRWLVVFLLLLAAALSVSLLDLMAFGADEAATLLRIGGRPADAFSLAGILQAVYDESPDQALGWPILVAIWARLVGWSEVALRSLSWFGGLLAIAMLWRAGRDMYGPAVGLVAAGLMATSVLFVTYMAIARTFTLVVLFTVLTLYGYWRSALRPGPVRQRDRALLLAGSSALLYLHYLGALLVPALCLFHLVFVRRDRRWLRGMAVFLLAGLAFLPEAGVLLEGLAFNRARADLAEQAMAPHVAVSRIVEVYSNGLVKLLPKIAGSLFILAAILLLYAFWRRRREGRPPDAAWLLSYATCAFLALLLVANEFVGVLLPGRMRYALGLWPLFSLLIALAVCRGDLKRPPRIPLSSLLLALLLVTGLVGNIRSSLRARYIFHRPVPPMHLAMRELEQRWQADDRLVIDRAVRSFPRTARVYTEGHAANLFHLQPRDVGSCDASCLAGMVQELRRQGDLWLLFANPAGELQTRLQQALLEAGLILCRRADYNQAQPLSLVHLARDEATCR